MSKNIHELLRESCLRAGISIVSLDSAAKLMSLLYVHGNNEKLVYNEKLRADLEFVQRKYGIQGGARPDMEFIKAFQKYVKELEAYEQEHKDDWEMMGAMPIWAKEFLKRYDIQA